MGIRSEFWRLPLERHRRFKLQLPRTITLRRDEVSGGKRSATTTRNANGSANDFRANLVLGSAQ